MKTTFLSLALTAGLLAGCAAQPPDPADAPSAARLPAGVIRAGSLSNAKLIHDAGMGAVAKLAQLGHTVDTTRRLDFKPYVVAMPSGRPGSRTWTERWYFNVSGKQVPVTLQFHEDGLGAASYSIK